MQTPVENGARDATHEVDSLCRLFPEYGPDAVKRAYRSAKAAMVGFEGRPSFMHIFQQKLS